MNRNVPASELADRMKRLQAAMDKAYPDWEMCGIVGAVNMYYLTGSIQDGMLLIERGGRAVFWVRRSYERALLESEFPDIRRMKSFRDAAGDYPTVPQTLYLDMSEATLQWYALLTKHMPFQKPLPADAVLLNLRSMKSRYEIDLMRQAGSAVDRLLREEVPPLLRTGMSEAELGAELLPLFIRDGHHGVGRFSMHNVDPLLGHFGFGVSSLYPSVFNGASGQIGLCPAAPVLGSRDVKLRQGDLVYIDVVFGVDGYHVDKTLVFSYGKPQPAYVEERHRHCLELERQAVSLLRPGVKPSDLYSAVCESVNPEFKQSFMGAPGRAVSFLGHGVGLHVDEWPVLAKGFDSPLEPGMTIAIEPKIGVEGIGMVGSENTYLCTGTGAECLTGTAEDIILCPTK